MAAEAPETRLGLRRLRVLRLVAGAPAPVSTNDLALKTGWTLQTMRGHLAFLLSRGLVQRVNYRRWALADGISLRSLDARSLD